MFADVVEWFKATAVENYTQTETYQEKEKLCGSLWSSSINAIHIGNSNKCRQMVGWCILLSTCWRVSSLQILHVQQNSWNLTITISSWINCSLLEKQWSKLALTRSPRWPKILLGEYIVYLTSPAGKKAGLAAFCKVGKESLNFENLQHQIRYCVANSILPSARPTSECNFSLVSVTV